MNCFEAIDMARTGHKVKRKSFDWYIECIDGVLTYFYRGQKINLDSPENFTKFLFGNCWYNDFEISE